MTPTESILFAIAIIGCVIAVINYFRGSQGETVRDKKENAEWRGRIDGKLDSILGLNIRVEKVEETMQQHEIDISKLKDSSKRAHERIDELRSNR